MGFCLEGDSLGVAREKILSKSLCSLHVTGIEGKGGGGKGRQCCGLLIVEKGSLIHERGGVGSEKKKQNVENKV